jgi:hypothetical protein
MDELTDRLIASRYGELAFLRALAVVETNKDTVATFFQHRATRDERAPTAREEVMRVAASRCVSGMGAAFRTALESSLSRQAVPRAAASQTHRNHGNPRTTAGRMSEANSAPVPPPVDEPVQTMPPPTVPGPVEFESGGRGGRADTLGEATSNVARSSRPNFVELRALAASGHVGRMLSNAFFRERIESVLLRNVENPNVSTVMNQLYPHLRGGRGLSSEGAAPRARTSAGRAAAPVEQPQAPQVMAAVAALHGTPPSLTGNHTLDNLTLVTGASFELLLSIQRMLQQELGAALRHTSLDVHAVTDHAVSGMAAMAAAATPAVMSSAAAGGGTSSGSGSDASRLGFINGSVCPSVRPSPTSRRTFPLGACVICTEAEVSTVFYKCGHMCACNLCAFTLKQRRAKCPICRAPITDVIQAFIACPTPEVSAAEEVASEALDAA